MEDENKVIITKLEYDLLKKSAKLYERIYEDLTEYMGFSDEYLHSDKWLMKYNKKDLITKIHHQRDVIRKLINELDESKREQYLKELNWIDNPER